MTRKPPALPAIAGEGCTERACTVDKVAEAMVRRRAECDRANAGVPRVAHCVSGLVRHFAHESNLLPRLPSQKS